MVAAGEVRARSSHRASTDKFRPPKRIADGRFEIEQKLGAGCFGEVYRGRDTRHGRQPVAVKFEVAGTGGRATRSQEKEVDTMLLLGARNRQAQGVAECFHWGMEGIYHCLVMELLGRNLEERLRGCGGQLEAPTVALIGEQVVNRLEYLHSKGIVHCDIKPENFMFGVGPRIHHLYLIDFGLSKRYYENHHVSMRIYSGLLGTTRYASIHAHEGREPSRRDDLEASGHMLMYLLRGSLPWSGMRAKSMEDQHFKVGQKKKAIPLEELCKGFPDAFRIFLQTARQLGFQERPDYERFRGLFQEVRKEYGLIEDHGFQWFRDREGQLGSLEPLEAPLCKQPGDRSRTLSPRPSLLTSSVSTDVSESAATKVGLHDSRTISTCTTGSRRRAMLRVMLCGASVADRGEKASS
jgi:serine/threonine protein kinase